MNQSDKTLTIKEVARFLNISNQMVYNLIKDKKIEAFRVGSNIRILHSDLLLYITQQKEDFRKQSEDLNNSDENVFMVKNLCFKREDFQLENISFHIPRGKILTILGPSGSGKTMLLKTLAGLNKPETGGIFLGTDRLDIKDSQSRNIGFVFEQYALFPNRSGRGNIRFPLEIQKKKRADMDKAVQAMAEEMNLGTSDLDSVINSLPEGVKQTIAIARADIRNIDILMMDEPLARLDQNVRMKMRVFLKELVSGFGKTTIITLHDPETALALSDYLAVLDEGKLVQFGPAREVYNNPVSRVVFEMTSRYAVNALNITVSHGLTEPGSLSADFEDGSYQLIFRADEVLITEEPEGLAAEIVSRHVLDGTRICTECRCENELIQLILPADTADSIRFKPLGFALFKR